MNRALRVARPALTIVVALAAAVAVTSAVSDGGSALLVVRAAADVLLVLAIAAVLGGVVAAGLQREAGPRGRLLDVAAGGAAAWTVVAAATALLLYLEQAPDPSSPSFGPGLVTFVLEVEIGRAWLLAASLAAVLTALLIAVRSRRGTVGLAMATVVAAVPVALQSAMSGDPLDVERGAVAAGLVQTVALGTWVGVLVLGRTRLVPVVASGAVVLGVGASAPALAADGALTGTAVVGAVSIVIAGVLAVVGARLTADLRVPQLLLLAVGLGLASAASVTRSMPVVPARTTPAEILTGSPLPQAPSFGALVGSWRPDAVWLVLAGGLLVGHLVAVRRAPTPWAPTRSVSWVVGLLLLVWLTNGGPAVYAPVLVAADLARLVAMLLVVPLLLAAGAPLRLLDTAWPTLRARVPSGSLARPVPALVLTLLVAAAVLGSGLLRWSLTDPIGTETTLALALVLGLLLVRSLGSPGERRRSAIVAAVVLLVVAAGAGALLATSSDLLVADWFGAMGWGTDALAAQRGAAVLVLPLALVPLALLLGAALRSSGAPAPALARSGAVTA
jgi:putative copper resistance protein D